MMETRNFKNYKAEFIFPIRNNNKEIDNNDENNGTTEAIEIKIKFYKDDNRLSASS